MQTSNLPRISPRYWAAITLASIFGANLGDFVSHVLHLGHYRGLPPLAVAFGLILLAERRLKLRTEAYYWLAIVTLRTAATNLGDLATHDFKLAYPAVLFGLAVLLVGLLAVESRLPLRAGNPPAAPASGGLPATNGVYWVAMLVAGTLGTAAGDYIADELGFGLVYGSLAECLVLAAMLSLRGIPGWLSKQSYWLTIVCVRTAGTTVGDFLASRHGAGLGLEASTVFTGILWIALLVLWRRPDGRRSDAGRTVPTAPPVAEQESV